MPTTASPLRYPGGKTKLYDNILDIFDRLNLQDVTYIEPFCGGCGLAIKLLINNIVSSLVLNDIDPLIFSFWYCVLYQTEDLINRIDECSITIDERDKQKQILQNQYNHSVIDVGFATLYLNRTNVSGIISAGPIGGRDQSGYDKLDARFNKDVLINKISTIGSNKDRISLYNLDVIQFIDHILPGYDNEHTFINFDPPYVRKGHKLYLNHFFRDDHVRLRNKIAELNNYWIVTYDNEQSVLDLYNGYRIKQITMNHSAGKMKKGKELIVHSNNIYTP